MIDAGGGAVDPDRRTVERRRRTRRRWTLRRMLARRPRRRSRCPATTGRRARRSCCSVVVDRDVRQRTASSGVRPDERVVAVGSDVLDRGAEPPRASGDAWKTLPSRFACEPSSLRPHRRRAERSHPHERVQPEAAAVQTGVPLAVRTDVSPSGLMPKTPPRSVTAVAPVSWSDALGVPRDDVAVRRVRRRRSWCPARSRSSPPAVRNRCACGRCGTRIQLPRSPMPSEKTPPGRPAGPRWRPSRRGRCP